MEPCEQRHHSVLAFCKLMLGSFWVKASELWMCLESPTAGLIVPARCLVMWYADEPVQFTLGLSGSSRNIHTKQGTELFLCDNFRIQHERSHQWSGKSIWASSSFGNSRRNTARNLLHPKAVEGTEEQYLNSIYLNIRFTMKTEERNSLPVLCVQVKRNPDGLLGHAVYWKPKYTCMPVLTITHHKNMLLSPIGLALSGLPEVNSNLHLPKDSSPKVYCISTNKHS